MDMLTDDRFIWKYTGVQRAELQPNYIENLAYKCGVKGPQVCFQNYAGKPYVPKHKTESATTSRISH